MTTNFSRGISTWRFLRLCWRAPLILITCAGILTRNVEPISQAQPYLFTSKIAYQKPTPAAMQAVLGSCSQSCDGRYGIRGMEAYQSTPNQYCEVKLGR